MSPRGHRSPDVASARGAIAAWAVCLATVALPASAFAGKINRYTSVNAEYARSTHRFASTDVDAAYYNPAGVAFGAEGFALEVGNQATWLGLTTSVPGRTSESSGWSLVSPTLMWSGRWGDWGTFGVVAPLGGGVVRAKSPHAIFDANKGFVLDSLAAMSFFADDVGWDNAFLEARNLYIGAIAGVTWRPHARVAIALGAKALRYDGSLELRGDIILNPDSAPLQAEGLVRADQQGMGYAAIVGVHLQPTDELHIGLRYESKTSIETTTDVDEQGVYLGAGPLPGVELVADGATAQSDIPAMASLGFSHAVGPRVRVLGSFAWYFNRQASYGDFLGYDFTDEVDDDWETGLGVEVQTLPWLLTSAGYTYFHTGHNERSRTANRYGLNGHFVGFGGRAQWDASFDLTASCLLMLYEDGDSEIDDSTVGQSAVVFGLESTFRF